MGACHPTDGAWFRKVLGQYPTGVCIVTSIDEAGAPGGMVVGSFTSVSLAPPLVGFLPARGSASWARIRASGVFCINILAASQAAVCRRIAGRGGSKFEGIDWRPAGSGAPVLADVVAWIDCDLHAVHEAGDHDFVLGAVRELQIGTSQPPLLFLRGGYGGFAALTDT